MHYILGPSMASLILYFVLILCAGIFDVSGEARRREGVFDVRG